MDSEAATKRPFHAESLSFIERVSKFRAKPYNELTLVEARERSRSVSVTLAGPVDYDGVRREVFVPSDAVTDGIPVYVCRPTSVETAEKATDVILVFYHGGGSVVGCRETVDTTCKMLSSALRCVVVNVEYRLAPEHRFPANVDDGCCVARWVLDHRVELGGTVGCKVGVIGDSAGGKIASSVAHDVEGLAFQILVYPGVSAAGSGRTFPSYSEYRDGPVLTKELVAWFDSNAADEADFTNPRFASLLRPRFDHLPPALIVIAECDQFRDECLEYAKKLTEAGVVTDVHLARGAIHAFYTMPGHFVQLCREAYQKTVEFVNRIAAVK